MVADFPLFGVGLGGWPDLYPHYRRPPWSPFFARQVGDDYIQLVAETGLIGSALVGWLVCAIFVRLHRGTRNLAPREFSRFAGVYGGIMAAMVHEVFDFSLRTPANAFLFAILSAIALRLALTHDRDSQPQIAVRGTRFSYLTTCILCLGALVLGVATATQDGSAYPYEVAGTRSLSDAAAFLVAHPAMAAAHLRLIDQSQRPLPADIELKQLTAAVWLDPNSPVARDAYARRMLGSGRKAAGLREVTESVYRAPQADLHTYLAPQLVPWLLPEEQDAIQTGFRRAVAARFGGALSAMLTFFDTLGRYADSARLSEQAAQSATNPTDKLEYLLFAGRTYAEAGDQASAFRTLTEALALAPTDPTPYVELARDVYGPSRQIHQLQLTIEAGKRAGADPFALDLALADGAQLANDHVAAEAALVEAQSYRADFDTAMRLGTLYLNDQDFARAVIAFEHAVDLKPDSPAAWSTLGEAEEAQYDYGAATKAYARAHALAPGDVRLAEAYENFQHRIADSPPAFGTTTGATPNR
jgi:tetratricopeptide (TPR) repeat protein